MKENKHSQLVLIIIQLEYCIMFSSQIKWILTFLLHSGIYSLERGFISWSDSEEVTSRLCF